VLGCLEVTLWNFKNKRLYTKKGDDLKIVIITKMF